MAEQRITKVKLSGSTNGRGIKVTQTATLGDTVHTADAAALDEVWLWAYNSHSAAVVLTIERGGVSDPDDHFPTSIPPGVSMMVCPGLLVTGSVVVTAFADQANKVSVHGFVNRIG